MRNTLYDNPTVALPRFRLEPAWFEAIAIRASRRRFDGRPVRAEALQRIGAACRTVSERADTGVRAVLVDARPDGVFTGLIGQYGAAVSGAPAFAAFLGGPDWDVDLGYIGEAVILAATAAGVDTCWIAGSFDPAAAAAYADLAEGEQVRAVTPLGYGTSDVRGFERVLNAVVQPRARFDLERIAPGASSWPAWARVAAEAVRLAPSGKNRQPWRLRLEDDALVLALAPDGAYWTAWIDCGIAALHAELGALHAGVVGTWQRLAGPDVARFTPSPTF
jgi:hypothetical protein